MKHLLLGFILVIATSVAGQQAPARMKVYFAGHCNENSTGAVVESSFRESILSSSGYTLTREKEPGTLFIAMACVDAGNQGEGWTAVAYQYGLLTKANPETLGVAVWNPTLGIFTVGREHAQSKGQELFAKFDNDMHQ
jgi:hypothetical protein